jgi:hypothetical protein
VPRSPGSRSQEAALRVRPQMAPLPALRRRERTTAH